VSVLLEAGVCRVRSWTAADAAAIVPLANDRTVSAMLRDRFPWPYTLADAEAFLAHALASRPETDLAIEAGGHVAGGIGFVPGTDIERVSAEVGYWLGAPFRGRGIATAALLAATRHAFDAFGVERVFALPFADNRASCRVLEKAGYAREGLLRSAVVKEGRLHDVALYARLRRD
jgi:RimJ/RimL family protein N-acetyltransferase